MQLVRRRLPILVVLGVFLACAGASSNIRASVPDDATPLRLEVLQLKRQLARAVADADACRGDLGSLRTRLNAIVVEAEVERVAAAIEAANPGQRVNRQTLAIEPAATMAPAKGPQP